MPVRILALTVCLGISASALAHHSFAMFDMNKDLTLTGTSRSSSGKARIPGLRSRMTTASRRDGALRWAPQCCIGAVGDLSLKPGDKVTAVLHPLRDGRRGGSLVSVTLPDGRQLFGSGGSRQRRPRGVSVKSCVDHRLHRQYAGVVTPAADCRPATVARLVGLWQVKGSMAVLSRTMPGCSYPVPGTIHPSNRRTSGNKPDLVRAQHQGDPRARDILTDTNTLHCFGACRANRDPLPLRIRDHPAGNLDPDRQSRPPHYHRWPHWPSRMRVGR